MPSSAATFGDFDMPPASRSIHLAKPIVEQKEPLLQFTINLHQERNPRTILHPINKLEQRVVIPFLTLKGLQPEQIQAELSDAYREQAFQLQWKNGKYALLTGQGT
jgi:hypothetical protein